MRKIIYTPPDVINNTPTILIVGDKQYTAKWLTSILETVNLTEDEMNELQDQVDRTLNDTVTVTETTANCNTP